MVTPPAARSLILKPGRFSVILAGVNSRKIKKMAAWTAGCLVLLIAVTAVALWASPPALLRIGANYTAKIVCSNTFIAGRDPERVLHEDVQAPGIWLMEWMRIAVDRGQGTVRAGLLGFIGRGLAVFRPGEGCAAVPDGRLEAALHGRTPGAGADLAPRVAAPGPWPEGADAEVNPSVARLLADDRLAGPGIRALLVAHRGRLIGERYADGVTAATPLLGWSMTKSVTAGWIGLLVKDGLLTLDDPAGLGDDPGDRRGRIKIADLMSMTSGLSFNESYGAVTDVTQMLYLEDDMAAFASAQPLAHPVGTDWSYSSGTALILARIAAGKLGGAATVYLRDRLFGPLGMSSALIETDAAGTPVGSSYMYATAQDWLRYAQMLLQQGVWQGHEILPRNFVAMMSTPVAASEGQYGQGMVWRIEDPAAARGLPDDLYWMLGHDGQSIAIVPSRGLVVLRMGLTPSRLGYRPEPLLAAVLAALETP
jgi:CubicO group peptidase (beta-lactamase class C family)